MKRARYVLGILAFTAGLIGPAMADDQDAPPISLPKEVKAFAPIGMIPIFYGANGLDAVIVVETKDDHPDNLSMDPYAHPQTRWLIMLRKEQGVYKEIDRSDKIVACSTCGRRGLDPFVPQGIELKNGKLHIEQDYTLDPSTAEYRFSYDPKLGHWVVLSATNTEVDQNMSGGELIRRTPQNLVLPKPPLLTKFDPGWHPRESGVAFTADDQAQRISLLRGDSSEELDALIKDNCTDKEPCHEVARQFDGCITIVKDGNKLYVGKSSVKLHGASDNDVKQREADNKAVKECKSDGGSACKVVDYDCV
jgi:hypothetical protein